MIDNTNENITMKDIAKLAGVSSATVSYILNDKKGIKTAEATRQKVLDICKQYNYSVDSAKTRKKKTKDKGKYTISDIAREAGVSTATVSYIINDRKDLKVSEATKKKVLQICNLRQYRPSPIAQALAGSKSDTIGICYNYEPLQPIRNCQNLKLITDLQSALRDLNYSTLLLPQILNDTFVQKNIDGIICIDLSESQFHNLKEDYFVPIVAIDMTITDTLFFKTYNDNKAIVAYAKELLNTDKITYVTQEFRNKPLMSKLKRALVNDNLYIVQNFTELKDFLQQYNNEYIVFDDENTAQFCLPYLNPDKTAVICHDTGANLLPELCHRINIPSEMKAKAAVKMLQDAINRNETEPHTIKISPQ